MKWILHFISFLILWSFVLSSYTAFSTPLFHKCMGIISKMRENRNMTSKQLVIQDRLKQLKSTHMSMNLKESSEYDRAIKNLAQLEKDLRDTDTLDSSEREALRIQIRELEDKVDELLQRNQQNIKERRQEIHELEQELQAEAR